MDPLSAIGLGASVLQFVSFTNKSCELIRQIHQDEYDDFRENTFTDLTRDFNNFSRLFRTRRQSGLDPKTSQSQESLDQLVRRCHDTARELSGIFHDLSQDPVIKSVNRHLPVRMARVKLFFGPPQISRLLAQAKDYREQLIPDMLACLPDQLDSMDQKQHAKIDSIGSGHSRIVEVVAVVKENLDTLKRQHEDLRRKMDNVRGTIDTTSISQHEKAMAAFLTFQNGETKLLTRTDGASFSMSNKQMQSLMTLRDVNSSCTGTMENFMPMQNMVLDSLNFRQIYERLENVRKAHAETYEWVFCPPEADMPWAPFLQWLESGTGCYWINGKPGSGKSTLMKFIAQHKRSREALEKWAGGGLVYASFFFWNLGSPLQKSQIGLLRSLLHDILMQQPGLISVVMPELWRAAAKLPAGASLEQPSLAELKQWFRKVLDPKTTSLKFFFLIDGIDEFEGDHNDIVELINDVNKNGNVRILLSSRPIPICEDAFSRWPNLRLQDLTRGDIQKYAKDHLLERLEQRDGGEWAALINEITDRSDGVFLWVILVVRSLADGLRKGDNIHEMRGRLNELPSDLKSLYEHMIRNMEPRYQRQGAELFQLVLKAHQVQSPAGFPLLLQVFFCGEEPERVVLLERGPLDPDYSRAKCDEVRNRIYSRTCGLIESRKFKTSRFNIDTKALVTFDSVDFIHRTVVEFLHSPGVWDILIELTSNPRYDPSVHLFQSCVMMCKTLPKSRGMDLEYNTVWHMMDRGLIYASMAEDSDTPVPVAHLKELDKAVGWHWASSMKCFSRLGTVKNVGHWAKGYTVDPLRQDVLEPGDFASVALFHGLGDYLRHEIADGTALRAEDKTRLLYQAVRYIGAPPWTTDESEFNSSLTSDAALFIERRVMLRPRWAKTAMLLLQAGADANEPVAHGESAWSLMLSYVVAVAGPHTKPAFHRDIEAKGFADLFARLLSEFVKRGADLSYCASGASDHAFKIVNRLFSLEPDTLQEFDPWTEQPEVVVSADIMKMQMYFKNLMESKMR